MIDASNGGEGDVVDVVGQFIQRVGGVGLVGVQALDHREGEVVEVALGADGGGVAAGGGFGGLWGHEVEDDLGQPGVDSFDGDFDQPVECGGRVHHLVGHQLRELGGLAVTELVFEHGADEEVQPTLGGFIRVEVSILVHADVGIGFVGAGACVVEGGVVERLFVAEVVLDRGDVGVGGVTDRSHGGLAVAVLGEEGDGGVEQASVGILSHAVVKVYG